MQCFQQYNKVPVFLITIQDDKGTRRTFHVAAPDIDHAWNYAHSLRASRRVENRIVTVEEERRVLDAVIVEVPCP